MRMRHPAFHSSLPRSSSSVGLSVKGDRLQNRGLADAGRRTTIYGGKLVFQNGAAGGRR
jgi:hypothetical protein